jgi:hypothetical protein
MSPPHPPTPSALCTAPIAREVVVVKTLDFLARDTCARATVFLVFRAKLSHGIFFVSPLPFTPPFLPRAPRLQVASLRVIKHKQASQCGNQMAQMFGRWCAMSTTSVAAAGTAATAMRS